MGCYYFEKVFILLVSDYKLRVWESCRIGTTCPVEGSNCLEGSYNATEFIVSYLIIKEYTGCKFHFLLFLFYMESTYHGYLLKTRNGQGSTIALGDVDRDFFEGQIMVLYGNPGIYSKL